MKVYMIISNSGSRRLVVADSEDSALSAAANHLPLTFAYVNGHRIGFCRSEKTAFMVC